MKQYYFLFLICIFCKISLGQIKQIDVSDQVTTILCPDSTVTIADEKFNLLNGKVNNLDSVIYVSSGKEYAFFLKADSTLWAIGNNVNGEQAIGSCDNDYHHLHKIQGLKKVVKIVSNSYHNVAAIDAEGYAWIWGYYKNNLNECEALGTTLCKPHKLDIDSVVDIAICYMTILIQTKDGKIWRGGGYDGLLEDVFDLKEVPGMKGIKKFGCGIYNGFGIDTVGNLFTCSYSNNEINFLDNNVSNVKSSNTLCIYLKNGSVWMRNIIDIENINIVGPTNVKEIICNEVGGVAISDSDEIWTWVYNGNGLYSQFQKRNWNCINCQKFTLDSLIIDTIINPNTNVQLYANKSSGNRYSWLPSIGVSDTTIQNPVINIESTNNYKVSLYNSDGCVYENDIIKLNVRLCDTIIKKYPLFALDTIVIPETSDTLKAMGEPPYVWSQTNGLSCDTCKNPIALFTENSTYTLNQKDIYNCLYSQKYGIKIRDCSTIVTQEYSLKFETTVSYGSNIVLHPSPSYSSYNWLHNSRLSCETCAEPIYTCLGNEILYVKLFNKWNCPYTEMFSIKTAPVKAAEMVIPDIITPNGDGFNDNFEIKNLKANVSLLIFNRQGQSVYSNSNYFNNWNGLDNNGKPLNQDNYFYVIKVSGEAGEYKGYVFIKR